MFQNECTVTAGPRLSKVGNALPQGFRAADSAELENVQGGKWWELALIIACPGGGGRLLRL
jgi:hypothetical protein